jgi:phosphoribosylamine--glycine ligase
MKILLVGAGGREHALGWRLRRNPVVELVAAPGNPGLERLGRCVAIPADDAVALAALAARERVDLVVIGPEVALAAGLADRVTALGIPCFGPTAAAAAIESSKAFCKDFCRRHAIPTADYEVFDDAVRAKAHLGLREPPFVIKADGLAGGKGVIIAETRREADAAVDEILFLRKFGSAGQRIVIEDFLPGEEASVFALCDGETAVLFGDAQDHKRAFDGDKGPNTGGMGAYSPARALSRAVADETLNEIILPAVRGLAAEGAPFRGVLFAGLMISPAGPKLIEFNARFGDPECQTLMRRFEGDLAAYLMAAATGSLRDLPEPPFSSKPCVGVVLAAQGYPETPLTGSIVRGLPQADALEDVVVFHAGTRRDEDDLLRAAGGRVLTVTATGDDLAAAVDRAYQAVDLIDWPGGFCRRDIARKALES